MRKIEQDMITAVRDARPWASGNTAVTLSVNGDVTVTLHGHEIAYFPIRGRARWTLAGWNTRTTRSRIRALARAFNLRTVCTIAGVPHVSESMTDSECTGIWHPVDANAWVNT